MWDLGSFINRERDYSGLEHILSRTGWICIIQILSSSSVCAYSVDYNCLYFLDHMDYFDSAVLTMLTVLTRLTVLIVYTVLTM